MQSIAIPGVFSGIIDFVPVVFHLAGVQRLHHLASVTFDALHMTLFRQAK